MTLSEVMVMLDEVIASTPPEDRPALVVVLSTKVAAAAAGMVAVPLNGTDGNGQSAEPERLLTPEQSAAIVGGVGAKWILRHTKGLRFRRDLSRKVVRFEEAGLRRWASARRV